MASFSDSEKQDIVTFNETLMTACTGDHIAVLVNLKFTRRCSDGVRRNDIHDYLDFLFPPNVSTYVESQTSSFTDRVIKLRDDVITHVEFVITRR